MRRETRPGGKRELERLVQNLERAHSDWSARQVESELEALAPVVYGNWKENTPNPKARLRQIQRWRRGYQSPPLPPAGKPLFQRVWPLGERQRQEVEPDFAARPTNLHASHRIFLRNYSTETLRELRAKLAGREVAYSPAIGPGAFLELPWHRHEAIRAAAIAAPPNTTIAHPLHVEFAFANGTKRGLLDGRLVMHESDGWVSFEAADGQRKEIE